MVSVAIFCMPKHAREAASCHASREAASCHASREAASGRFGWWQVRLVAGSIGGRISVYRNGVLIWIITNLTMKN